MDPAKSADLVLLHLAAEVQQIISELQVSEANLTMKFFTSEVQEVFPSSCLYDITAEVVHLLSVSHQDDHLVFRFLSSLLQPR